VKSGEVLQTAWRPAALFVSVQALDGISELRSFRGKRLASQPVVQTA